MEPRERHMQGMQTPPLLPRNQSEPSRTEIALPAKQEQPAAGRRKARVPPRRRPANPRCRSHRKVGPDKPGRVKPIRAIV